MERARVELQKLEKQIHSSHKHVRKWPDQDAKVKNLITDNTEDRISVPISFLTQEEVWSHMTSVILLGHETII
jgi:hypothetical protein